MVARETRIAEGLGELGLGKVATPARVSKLLRLLELLETQGVSRGFVSARDTDRLLSRHVLECAALQLWLPPSGVVVDVGSGAGLPGLVLATLRKDKVVLVEATARRATFLREASYELGLATEIVAERAEVVGRGDRRESAPAVVARALARIPVALELTLPLAEIGGMAAILIGSDDAARSIGLGAPSLGGSEKHIEGLGSSAAAEELGGGPPEVHGFEVPGAEERRWVMIVRKLRRTPDRYPRSAQALKRSPLGGSVA